MLDLGLEVEAGGGEYIRRDGVTDYILELARKAYGKRVSKEDIFFYVYGFLHSPDYTTQFANDLKKSLPRLPLVEEAADFWAFSKAGRELADLHLNYETHPAPEGILITGDTYASDPESAPEGFYAVEKMRHPSKDDTSVIIYNSRIKIEGIPPEAYTYVVNGRTPIAWIMEHYQIKTHKESQVTNNPNHWAIEHNHPRYILDLLLSVINLSLQTHHTLHPPPNGIGREFLPKMIDKASRFDILNSTEPPS